VRTHRHEAGTRRPRRACDDAGRGASAPSGARGGAV
jgi:hypothetical protein